MGLVIDVFRRPADQDFTLGGISGQRTELTVVNATGPFEPNSLRPAVFLESHVKGCLRLVPAEKMGDEWVAVKNRGMFGGNYGACSDSRFSEACERILGSRFYGAVAIHDRYEY
jgi:hypothetical protein